MTPEKIIEQATLDGLTLDLTDAGELHYSGTDEAVARWLPVLRGNKPSILAALQEAANELLPDPAMETRRQRVLALLAERPGIKYAVVVDSPDDDPVIVALGIRGQATFEFHVAREKFDPFLLLDLIERHGGTVH